MEKEEGEMSDVDDMVVDEEEFVEKKDPGSSTLVFKAEKDVIIIQHQEKVDALKLEERAKRFGLNLASSRVVTQKQIDELYEKSGIKSGNERHFRFDTIHLNGIDCLTTREIFEYLEDYKPVSLERINDTSCNVVCQDHIAAALALLVHSREVRSEELKAMLSDKADHWREGMPHPKKDLILMRFATHGDKKVIKNKPVPKPQEYIDESMEPVNKNPWGDLCKSWGVYDHQEIFLRKVPDDYHVENNVEQEGTIKIQNKRLAKRLGKRSKQNDSEESNSDTEWTKKSKTPRMRMHADDEESKQKKESTANESGDEIQERSAYHQDTYQPLSIEVVNSRIDYVPRETSKLSDKFKSRQRNTKDSVQSRLGRFECEESYTSDSNSSDGVEHNVMSRINKVRSKPNSVSSVWNRLAEKNNSVHSSISSNQKDLRQYLKVKKEMTSDDTRKKERTSDDLRNKIKKTKKVDVRLRIEIENNIIRS